MQHHGGEEPGDDAAAEQRCVEGGDGAGRLVVVGRERDEDGNAEQDEQQRDGKGDVGERCGRAEGVDVAHLGGLSHGVAPVEHGGDVNLLRPLDDAGSVYPGFYGSTT